jgi:hypothetical protein
MRRCGACMPRASPSPRSRSPWRAPLTPSRHAAASSACRLGEHAPGPPARTRCFAQHDSAGYLPRAWPRAWIARPMPSVGANAGSLVVRRLPAVTSRPRTRRFAVALRATATWPLSRSRWGARSTQCACGHAPSACIGPPGVRDGYAEGRTCSSIAAQLPGRTPAAVAARAAKLGLSDYARRWNAEDDARLIRLVATRRPLMEAARVLVRTPEAVRRRCRRLGLPTPPPSSTARRGRPWSEEEDEVLRLHAGVNPATLALLLGRSDRAVTARLRRLGLRAARERSPHHPTPRAGRLTPRQRAAVERAAAPLRGTSLSALARRLDVPPTAIGALLEGLRASHRSHAAPELRRRAG